MDFFFLNKKINCISNTLEFSITSCLLCRANVKGGKISNLCTDCETPLLKPPYLMSGDKHFALAYSGPIVSLIHQAKFGGNLAAARTLGEILAASLNQKERVDAVVAVPLHWRREWGRGFNQAREIARPLSKKMKTKLEHRLIIRHHHTQPQTLLSNHKERLTNIRHAFSLKSRSRHKIRGCRVAVVDDVVTTGATTAEIKRCLIAGGAARVMIWAVAKSKLS